MNRILLFLLLASAVVMAPCASAAESLFVVHFTTGPSWQSSLPPGEQTGFAEHSANLRRLREAGRIHFGARYGPFGMIFLGAENLEDARAELEADPGVVAGIFTFEVAKMNVFYPWLSEAESTD